LALNFNTNPILNHNQNHNLITDLCFILYTAVFTFPLHFITAIKLTLKR